MTLEDLRPMVATLTKFSNESTVGETKQFLSANELEEINGNSEPFYMTRIANGVVVHYGTDGDWTKALLIPCSQLDGEDYGDQYSPADEALEWFFD